jgi:hypothetical protein
MSTTLTTGGYNAPKVYLDTALTNTVVGATIAPCNLTGWNIINANTSDVYVKFFDVSSGTVTLGTTQPVKTLLVPSSSTIYLEHNKEISQYYFSTALSLVCVTGLAVSNTTAPTTAIYIETYYTT